MIHRDSQKHLTMICYMKIATEFRNMAPVSFFFDQSLGRKTQPIFGFGSELITNNNLVLIWNY